MANFCSRCGSLVFPGSDSCPSCGAYVSGESRTKQRSLTEIAAQHRPAPRTVSEEDMKAPYLPYEPRPSQLSIISDIREAMDAGRHIVIESGTGTGKTIVSLAAALEHSKPRNKKVVYLTRTISQSDQVMRELKAISSLKRVTGIAVTGRGKSCLLMRTVRGYESLPPQVLSSLCEEKKSKRACPYFNTLRDHMAEVESFCLSEFPKSDKLDEFCESLGTCPYEMKKLLMKGMDVVVAPYVHILSEDIRSNLLNNLDSDGGNLTIVIDEAHNLVDAAREQESFSISLRLVQSALDECSTIRGGDAMLCDGVMLVPFITHLKNLMRSLATSKLGLREKEALLEPRVIEGSFFSKFSIDRHRLEMCIDRLQDIGDNRTEILMERGENRVSELFDLAVALRSWMMTPDEKYVRTIKTGDDGEVLHAACISPSDVTSFLRKTKGVLHMSGTLQPLEQYVRTMMLPEDTVTRIYPSPFPKENLKVVYMENVTTQQKEMAADPSISSRIHRYIAKMCNAVDRNTLVFFPSYRMMHDLRPFLEEYVKKKLYWEEPRQLRRTMQSLDVFRKGRDGVFFSVMGGSVAEGIDFPGDELCFAIIVGIPYPPPTLESKAMSDMFDRMYGRGKGWEYVSVAPAVRKMKQAIGRLIRTEEDRGMAVIMDKRAARYVRELDCSVTRDPVGDVASFFGNQKV